MGGVVGLCFPRRPYDLCGWESPVDYYSGELVGGFAPRKGVIQGNEDGRGMGCRTDIMISSCPSTGKLGGSAGRRRGDRLRPEGKW